MFRTNENGCDLREVGQNSSAMVPIQQNDLIQLLGSVRCNDEEIEGMRVAMSSLQRKNGQLKLELQRAVGDRQEALREMERDKTSLISLDSKHKNDLLKFERDNEEKLRTRVEEVEGNLRSHYGQLIGRLDLQLKDNRVTIARLHEKVETLHKNGLTATAVNEQAVSKLRGTIEALEHSKQAVEEAFRRDKESQTRELQQNRVTITALKERADGLHVEKSETASMHAQTVSELNGKLEALDSSKRLLEDSSHRKMGAQALALLSVIVFMLIGWGSSHAHMKATCEMRIASLNTSLGAVTESLTTTCADRVAVELTKQDAIFNLSVSNMQTAWNISCSHEISSNRAALASSNSAALIAQETGFATRLENVRREAAYNYSKLAGAHTRQCEAQTSSLQDQASIMLSNALADLERCNKKAAAALSSQDKNWNLWS